jgi:hypothetical protein
VLFLSLIFCKQEDKLLFLLLPLTLPNVGSVLHSLSIKLEDRYINHWKKLLFNDDNKNGGNKLQTYRKLKNSYKMEKFLHSDVSFILEHKPSLRKVFSWYE